MPSVTGCTEPRAGSSSRRGRRRSRPSRTASRSPPSRGRARPRRHAASGPARRPPKPLRHRARHVEREQEPLAGRLDVLERRVERGVERVDDRRHRRPACCRPRTPRPAAYVRSAASSAIGWTRALRMRSRSPSWATTFAVPSEPGASTPMRVIVARLRTSAVIGMSSSSASHTSGRGQVLGRDRLARQAVLADELRRPGRRLRRLREREALDDPRQALGLAAARDPLEQAAVLVVSSSVGLPAPTRAAGWASRSRSRCVMPSRWRYLTAW